MIYPKYPPSIDWEVTSACNHNCIHCYNYWRKTGTVNCASYSSEYYLNVAQRIVEEKPVSVQITGGEPLLVWRHLKDAVKILLDAGISVSINTNATLVTDKIAAFLAANQINAFVSFPCSYEDIFNQIVGVKGASECAKAGIEKLIRHGVEVSPNMVVTRVNLPYIFETAKYVKDRFGAEYFSATKASFPQNANESFRNQILDRAQFNKMLRNLLQVKEELHMRVDSAWVYSMCGFEDQAVLDAFGFNRRCGCGRFDFVVDTQGNMKACGCDSASYGNILVERFETAISRMTVWQDGSLLSDMCKTCPTLKYCGGGCRSDSLITNGAYCTLDSTGDDEKCHRELVTETRNTTSYPDDFTVRIHPNAVWVKENCGVRIHVRTNYVYISESFATLIHSSKGFSIGQLRKASGQSNSVVYNCIRSLLHKGLAQEMTMTEDVIVTKGSFDLLVSPYVEKGDCQLIQDYAGSACILKRH